MSGPGNRISLERRERRMPFVALGSRSDEGPHVGRSPRFGLARRSSGAKVRGCEERSWARGRKAPGEGGVNHRFALDHTLLYFRIISF